MKESFKNTLWTILFYPMIIGIFVGLAYLSDFRDKIAPKLNVEVKSVETVEGKGFFLSSTTTRTFFIVKIDGKKKQFNAKNIQIAPGTTVQLINRGYVWEFYKIIERPEEKNNG